MKKILLVSVAVLGTTMAFAKSFNIGVEAGYDFAHYSRTAMDVSETIVGSSEYKTMDVMSHHGKVIDYYSEVIKDGKKTKSEVNTIKTGRLPQMHGFHVGPTFDWRFADSHGLGLRFGLQYQYLRTNGGIFDTQTQRDSYKGSDSWEATNQHSLQLPIRLSYTWDFSNDTHLWLMTGPKFNIGVSMTTTYYDANSGTKEIYNYYNGDVTTIDKNGNKNVIKGGVAMYIPFDASWGFGIGFGWGNLNLSASYDIGFTDMSGYRHFGETIFGGTKFYTAIFTNNSQLQVTLSYTLPVLKK